MAVTTYTNSIANDFPGGDVNPEKWDAEIRGSDLETALKHVVIDPLGNDADRIDTVFNAALSAGDKTKFDGDTSGPAGGFIAIHNNTASDSVAHVIDDSFATIEDPTKNVQRVAIQPGRTGFYMNFRDFRLNTSIYAAADSFEDLRVNPSDNKRAAWGEITHVGCYKGDDTAGYTVCDDQTDADANATLSIWDYCANDQAGTPSPLDVDIKGGAFWVNSALPGTGEGLWKHQLYVLIAPNLPTSVKGAVPFFDSYLLPHQGAWLGAENSLALSLDPSVSAEAARVRAWVYYPAGAKTSHVLALKLFRNVW